MFLKETLLGVSVIFAEGRDVCEPKKEISLC